MTTAKACQCGRPTAGAYLCQRCTRTLDVALVNIAAYWADVETVQTKRARYGDNLATKSSIGKAVPLPIDARFSGITTRGTAAKWDAWATIVAWCRVVMEEQPQLSGAACVSCLHVSCAAVRRRRWPSANTIPAMCIYLLRQRRWLEQEAFASDVLDELLHVEKTLRRLIDRPADRWYAGRCSIADEHGVCEVELYAVADSTEITCPGCGFVHDVASRRQFLLDQSDDYLVTATEAADALVSWTDEATSSSALHARIRKWRERDQLTVRGHAIVYGKDRPLYRLGDVRVLLVASAQRAQSRRVS